MIDLPLPGTAHLLYVLFLAVAFDLFIGEPPTKLHPVVWIGNLITFLERISPDSHRKLYGVFLGLACITFTGLVAWVVLMISASALVPGFVSLLLEAYLLKSTFAIRRLLHAGSEVYEQLDRGDIVEGRKRLSMYVSRDTSSLSEEQVSSSVMETVSENYVDSILTPLFFYSIAGPFGLVAAYAFKAVSTLDSMVGYMDEKHIDIGFFSAKLDDVLNWIPARASVIYIMAASSLLKLFEDTNGLSPAGAFRCARGDCARPSSPNSGFPMAAVAGALQVRLEKPGTYVIGDNYSAPMAADIIKVCRIIAVASILSVIVFSLTIYIIGELTRYS
ncbi:MAG: cobalamin biosynthesis protein [Euryarchaeota archaeon]|nr:cobalamin biosynthesis protein [Euryarchaeota archaeon]